MTYVSPLPLPRLSPAQPLAFPVAIASRNCCYTRHTYTSHLAIALWPALARRRARAARGSAGLCARHQRSGQCLLDLADQRVRFPAAHPVATHAPPLGRRP